MNEDALVYGEQVEGRGQPSMFWELNSGCQTWQQVSSPVKPSHWADNVKLI